MSKLLTLTKYWDIITLPALVITLPILMCSLAGNLSNAESTRFTLLSVGGAVTVISCVLTYIAYRIGASSTQALTSGLFIFPAMLVGLVIISMGMALELIIRPVLPIQDRLADMRTALMTIFLLVLGLTGGLFPLLIGRSNIQVTRS